MVFNNYIVGGHFEEHVIKPTMVLLLNTTRHGIKYSKLDCRIFKDSQEYLKRVI